MKKLMIIIGFMFLTIGCTPIGEDSIDSATSSVESTYSEMDLNQSNSELRKDSSNTKGVGSGEDAKDKDSTTLKPTVSEIRLVPQKADRESGFTLENDTVLQGINERMKEAEVIGIPDDVAIHFTGMVLNETEKTQAVFILVNLTKMTMKNIKMTISFSNTENEIILDKASFDLTQDRFGLFEPNTAMPVYIDIPEDKKEIFNQLKDFSEMVYSIDSFEYEEV